MLSPFADLSPGALAEVSHLLARIEPQSGDEIYAQGSAPDALYLVGRGRVEVVSADDAGNERVVNTVRPGQMLGLSSFSRHTPRTTSARAVSDTVIFKLTRTAYEAIVGPSPGAS